MNKVFLIALLFLCFSPPETIGAEKSKVLASTTKMLIHSDEKATLSVHEKILIADKYGKSHGEVVISEDKYKKLANVKVQIFDAKGKKKKSFKKKHFDKIQGAPPGILVSGDTYYYLNVSDLIQVPYTIEIEYTVSIKSLFFWPAWSPQEDIVVEEASYTLETPANYEFKSFSPSDIKMTQISTDEYQWKQSNLPPYPDEKYMPADVYDTYRVFFSTGQFTLEGYTGSESSWEGIANFYWELTKSQFDLDTNSVNDLIIEPSDSKADTIRQIYNYVQEKTRYVAMSLGIHGWKPHTSQWVCDNSYGDCKDLSTFFISLLSHHNIIAHPVLILTKSAGEVYPEFPNNRFNHVIACVPLEKDSLWIDCTYDEGAVDFLPPEDQGRFVLVVGGEGPVLAKTPILSSSANQTSFTGSIHLQLSGSATLEGELELIGTAARRWRSSIKRSRLKEQRELIISSFKESAPGLELEDFQITNLDDKNKSLTIHLKSHIPHLGSKTGKRLFVNLAMPGKIGWYGEHPKRRTKPYNAGSPSRYSAQIELTYADGLSVESTPKDFLLETDYGSYSAIYSHMEGVLKSSWVFEDNQPYIPIDAYEVFYNFRKQTTKANSAQIVFIKG